MAENVVNFVLNNLSHLLIEEANLLSGVKEKAILFHQELERINAFLRRSEGERDEHKMVKVVVCQIRDAALEGRDVIDNYIVDINNHRRKGCLYRFFHKIHKCKMLRSVNNQIETIMAKMKDIYDNKDKYGISEGESATLKMEALSLAETVQRRRRDVEEDEVVGFDEYADEVTKLLMKGNTSRQVVSIVGMVGCGKTTLARKVFRDPQLNVTSQQDGSGFDCLAWEIATKEFNAKELLLNILRSFKAKPEDEDELKRIKKDWDEKESDSAKTQEIAMLKNKLREYLSDKRYLVVIDDVWSSQALEEIGDAFPDGNKASRILVTTRSEEVASKISTIEPYKLKPLSDEDSWILFSKTVFRGEKCPPNLETLGRNAIAYMGLPLAIVVIAGILRSKEKSERVWEKVAGHVNWYISQEDTPVKETARLSYETLPTRLKPCFLYFGVYPRDYDIPVRQLLQLWIAEGFIHETGDGSMIHEDIAEEYLEELIRRNLIQVESKRMDGGVKTCRIHDRLRELCMSERMEDNFLEVRNDNNILKAGKPRRLSIHGSIKSYRSESPCDHSCTRSLFNFSKDKDFEFKKWLREKFKLIRVVDIGQVKDSNHVVDELEELIHLRYFRTRDAHMTAIPNSICDLWNLETLDLRGSTFNDLPEGIWKLKRLRHLYMLGFASNATLPNNPGSKILPNLQTLSGVRLDQKTAQQLENGRFPNLRKLVVDCLHSSDEENPIEYLQRLECLSHLNTLKVMQGKTLSSVAGFPPNITKMTLVSCPCLSEIVSHLGSLPTLRYLKISGQNTFQKFKLECNESGRFPQLQVLKMTYLNCESWNLGKGAMPQLRHLVINRCEISTSLPSAESFTNLKEVEVLYWPSKEVVDKLQHLVSNLKDSCKLTIYPALAE